MAKMPVISYYNEEIIHLDCSKQHKQDILDLIKDKYPNIIIEDSAYKSIIIDNYYKVNLQSSYDKNSKYILFDNTNQYWVSDKSMINNLRNIFEKNFFVDNINYDKLHFYNLSSEQYDKYLGTYLKNDKIFGIPMCENDGHYNIAGFKYLQPSLFGETKNYFICMQEGKLLGVIKHGIYGNGNYKHQAIAYIDVNIAYRNQGIATLMIKQLDKYLEKDLPLFLTHTSELGKKCKIEEIFIKNIKKVPVVKYEEQEVYYTKYMKPKEETR